MMGARSASVLLAVFALLRLKMGILPLIGLAGLAGLGLRLAG